VTTILVADDDTDIARFIEINLRLVGFDVLVAHDGEQAERVIRDESPDLVLLDVMMPKMDGVELCRRVRANSLTWNLPIIMVTGKSLSADKVVGLTAGADDYLIKPFDVLELVARVRTVFDRRARLLDEVRRTSYAFDMATMLGLDGEPLAPLDPRYVALAADVGLVNADLAVMTLGETGRTIDQWLAEQMAIASLRARGYDVRRVGTEGHERPTAFPPDLLSELPSKRLITVTAAVASLIPQLAMRPQDLHRLTPSQFEEVVAELMHRTGCDVLLSGKGADGGVDVYAARKERFGKFLFLVQCKRYATARKVEVDVVRSLHSVVATTRNATAGVVATTSTFSKQAEEHRGLVAGKIQVADMPVLETWLRDPDARAHGHG
jgi:CheY-like chemotaxis protein